MSVKNCKVEYIRKEGYTNLERWCQDPSNVYVGRAGVVFIEKNGTKERFPKTASPFCNPFKVGKDGTRDEVIEKFRSYIKAKLNGDPGLEGELRAMKGKNLGCWCAPEPCHANVLLEIINAL